MILLNKSSNEILCGQSNVEFENESPEPSVLKLDSIVALTKSWKCCSCNSENYNNMWTCSWCRHERCGKCKQLEA